MKFRHFSLICLLYYAPAHAAIELTGDYYYQDFNQLAAGLPLGWQVAVTNSAQDFVANTKTWGETAGGFKNFASASIGKTAESTAQHSATDRALGIRQTGTFGDPGAAFVLNIKNTIGLRNFKLKFEAQMLSVQSRSTVWSVQYCIASCNTLITYSDPNVFATTVLTAAIPENINNQADNVQIRIIALSDSTGSGYRDSFGIDNFRLEYEAIPKPIPVPIYNFNNKGFYINKQQRNN